MRARGAEQMGSAMTAEQTVDPRQYRDVIGRFAVWELATYMFLHGGLSHILFNMLGLWMFGVDLERRWGTRAFTKYYFITGVGAAITTLLLSLVVNDVYYSVTVGASGAIYGLLLGYGMYFPNRPIYVYFVFPIPARIFVLIVGAIAFFSALGGPGGGVAHSAHFGGLIVGYLYLKGGNIVPRHPGSELKYWYLRWKFSRARKKFGVVEGGRANDGSRRIH